MHLIKKIKDKIKNEDNKQLLFNFIFLFIFQVTNYVFPFITFSYLVRVLGVEKFGLLSFALATITYFNILTDYGFNLTAPREIAINRDNPKKTNEIYCAVMYIKSAIFIISLVLITIMVFTFKKFSTDWQVYFYYSGYILGQILFPIWFFQGIEKMKHITSLNFISKIVYALSVFLFIKNEDHYLLVPLFYSLSQIIAGIFSQIIIFKYFKIRLEWVDKETIFYHIKNAFHVFISNIAKNIYTVSTTFILGLFTNNTTVGYYASAERIIFAIKSIMYPISQSLYPFMSKKINQSKEKGLFIIKKILILVSIGAFVCSILLFLFSKNIVYIILGKEYIKSVLPLKIMSLIPFFVAVSNIFGLQIMLPFDRKKAFSNIMILACAINILLSFILIHYFTYIGSSITALIVEIFVTLAMFIYLESSGIPLIKSINKKNKQLITFF